MSACSLILLGSKTWPGCDYSACILFFWFLSHLLATCNQVCHWDEDVRGDVPTTFSREDAVYVCRWWKGHACHLSSSSSVMEWWRGDECWRHRGGLRRNSWCVKYQRTIFPGNVPLHPSSLVFVHILISVRVSWPQEKRRVSEPPWSSQSTTCLCVIAESLSFARTVLRLYQRIVLKPVSPAGAILLVKSADHS